METTLVERPTIIITGEQVELIMNTVCKGATAQERDLFFYDCQRRGVHPLDRKIHFTIRTDQQGRRVYTPLTSIDYMRERAMATEAYAGQDPARFEGDAGQNGFQASVTVYRFVQGQRCSWTATARWSEYYPGERLGFMWRQKPYLMVEKCAEALALRRAFPAELQGLYDKVEMDQAKAAPGEEMDAVSQDEAPPPPEQKAPPRVTPPQGKGDAKFYQWVMDQLSALKPNQQAMAIGIMNQHINDDKLSVDQQTALRDYFRERWGKKE